MKVIRNTYPVSPQTPHAKPGDSVYWSMYKGCFRLVRKSDGKTVFATAPVNKDGLLRSNGLLPKLTGVIAEVKSKGWILEIGQELK